MSWTHSRCGCIGELCIRVVGVVVVSGCASSADEVRTSPILASSVLAIVFAVVIIVAAGNVDGELRVGGSRRGGWGGGGSGCWGVCGGEWGGRGKGGKRGKRRGVGLMMGSVAAFAGEFGDDEGVGFGDGVGKALNDDLFEVGGGWGESYWAGGGFGDMVDKGEEGGGECSEAVG